MNIDTPRPALRRSTANRAIVLLATVLIVIAAPERASMQTPATGRLMREKLVHAQRLLEAITTSNYNLLERETQALVEIPKAPAWMVLNSPEYRRYSEAFQKATQALLVAAKNRDLDKAVTVYQDVTMSCYRCHQYIKNMRLAK